MIRNGTYPCNFCTRNICLPNQLPKGWICMKIALNRSSWRFWLLYFFLHFSLLLIVLLFFKWLWSTMNSKPVAIDLGEVFFESVCYSALLSIGKFISYRIGKKRYEKNPVDRRRNNLFRE